MPNKEKITVEVTVPVPVDKAWNVFTDPNEIVKWNFASEDWCCPKAVNDLCVGGVFNYRMEAKNGSMGFDFFGTYTEVEAGKSLKFELGDGRKVHVEFDHMNGKTHVIETFEAEDKNAPDRQRTGWQAILDNYAKIVANHLCL